MTASLGEQYYADFSDRVPVPRTPHPRDRGRPRGDGTGICSYGEGPARPAYTDASQF